MDASTAMLGVVPDPALYHQGGATVVAALEAAYQAVQAEFPALPDAVIITGSGLSGYGLTWGHFARDRWHDAVRQGRRPELFIGGERLATGPTLTMQTLLHECAHALADARGVQDTSRQHRYHNRRFVAIAEELGLEYRPESPDSVIGFSAVTLSRQGASHWSEQIDAIGRAIRLTMGTDILTLLGLLGPGGEPTTGGGHGMRVTGRGKGTGGSSYVKAQCACEPVPRTIRVAASTLAAASITCGECGEDFTA